MIVGSGVYLINYIKKYKIYLITLIIIISLTYFLVIVDSNIIFANKIFEKENYNIYGGNFNRIYQNIWILIGIYTAYTNKIYFNINKNNIKICILLGMKKFSIMKKIIMNNFICGTISILGVAGITVVLSQIRYEKPINLLDAKKVYLKPINFFYNLLRIYGEYILIIMLVIFVLNISINKLDNRKEKSFFMNLTYIWEVMFLITLFELIRNNVMEEEAKVVKQFIVFLIINHSIMAIIGFILKKLEYRSKFIIISGEKYIFWRCLREKFKKFSFFNVVFLSSFEMINFNIGISLCNKAEAMMRYDQLDIKFLILFIYMGLLELQNHLYYNEWKKIYTIFKINGREREYIMKFFRKQIFYYFGIIGFLTIIEEIIVIRINFKYCTIIIPTLYIITIYMYSSILVTNNFIN